MVTDAERSGGLVGADDGAGGEKPVVLQITFDPGSGGIQVGGPLDNPMLCYAMLEMARDVVYRQRLPGELNRLAAKAAQRPGLVVANGPIPPFRTP